MDAYRRALDSDAPAAGYYHRNIPATVAGTKVIIRIPIHRAESMDLRMWQEPEIMRAIEGRVPHVPRLLHASRDPSFQVHEFIEGRLLHEVAPRGTPVPEHVLTDTVALFVALSRLTAAHLPPAPAHWPCDGDTAGFAQRINADSHRIHEATKTANAALYRRLRIPEDPFAPLRERWDTMTSRPFALAHTDVHRKNIILSGGHSCFLDWELALLADPVYEFATHLHKTAYLPHERRALVDLWSSALPGDATVGYAADLEAYLAHEQIKSVLVDAVRYARAFADAPAPYPPDVMVAKLAEMLAIARGHWGITASVDKVEVEAALRAQP
ncbi:phosphotransferase family protein [Actinocrinis puniceicyclus]|nr:aminoglycoside phosphotransferase family protein [Actinocrinis puniceicyclus]